MLTRKPNEVILIGDEIRVTILGVRGDKVRVGVIAPKDVEVHRLEVVERMKRAEEGPPP